MFSLPHSHVRTLPGLLGLVFALSLGGLFLACGGGSSQSPEQDPSQTVTQYTVTFDAQGGSPTPGPVKVNSGSTITLPVAPTRTSYSFTGWFTQKGGSGTAFTASTKVTKSLTVYAAWKSAAWVWPAASGTTINGNQTVSAVDAQNSAAWAYFLPTQAKMKVENNTWGMESPNLHGTGTCTIFHEQVNGAYTFGWAWDLTSTAAGGVIAYPEIGWGWSPNSFAYWNGATEMHKLSEKKSYTVDFNLRRTDRSGTWNTAFDIWIYPTANPTSKTSGGYELMIWLDHVNQYPWGSNPQTVSLAGHTWTAYNNDGSSGWTVLTYIAGSPINDATGFDLTAFFNDAMTRYGVPSSDYINAIEFGSETCGGKGMLEVANYNLRIQ